MIRAVAHDARHTLHARHALRATLAVLLFGAAPLAVGAQTSVGPLCEFVLEAGAMSLRQRDGGIGRAQALTAQARSLWSRAALEANATLVGTTDQGAGDASAASLIALGGDLLWPGTERARLEAVASYTSFGALGGRLGAQRSVMARQHLQAVGGDGAGVLAGLSAGAFAGAGLARAERSGVPARATTVEAGGWLSRGALSTAVVASRSTSTDWQLIEASGYALRWPAAAYQVQDVRVSVRAQFAAFELYGGAAWRGSMGGTVGSSRVAQVGAAWQVTPRWSLVGGTGRHLADLLRGTPELRQHMVMLRWQHAPWRSVPASFGGGVARVAERADGAAPVRRTVGGVDAANTAEVQVQIHAPSPSPSSSQSQSQSQSPSQSELPSNADSIGGALLVRLPAAGAERAEVSGSFNGWQPVSLVREGAYFTARVPVPRGPHRVSVRYDGGAWRAPRGTVRVDDGFGGESGLVVVPE